MSEAGVPGSEVVERQAGTLFFQFGCDAVGVLGVADESTFGDFEDKTVEGEVGLFGGSSDFDPASSSLERLPYPFFL